jgi:hypothetical protein
MYQRIDHGSPRARHCPHSQLAQAWSWLNA